MKNVHFAIPEIYGETLSYYELLRKLVDKTNELIDNYNTVPEQIAEAVANLDASQLFSEVLNQLIHSIATDNTKSANAVNVYKKHDLLYATFNEAVNLYESLIDFSTGTATELIPGTNIREVNISELFIELRKLIENEAQADQLLQTNIDNETQAREQADTALQTNIDNETQAREQADRGLQTNIDNEARAREQADRGLQKNIDNEINTLRTMISSPYNFKGEVASISALPASGEVNDTYYVQDAKYKVTWTGSAWVQSSLSEADYQEELSELKGDVDTLTDTVGTSSLTPSLNFNKMNFTDGYYITINGPQQAPTWTLSDKIGFSSNVLKTTMGFFYAFYNGDTIVSAGNIDAGDSLNVPDNANYIRMAFVKRTLNKAYVSGLDFNYYLYNNNIRKSIYVGTDKVFTKITDAIIYANKTGNCDIYVDRGTYDIVSELGDLSNYGQGIVVGNNTRIYCDFGTVLTCHYTGDNTSVNTDFSVLKTNDSDFEIYNMTIDASNIRYCVHDDCGYTNGSYKHEFHNCNMKLDNTNNKNWSAKQCIGGGLGRNATIIIEGGKYNSVGIVSTNEQNTITYHNNGDADDSYSKVVVKDVYFETASCHFGCYGPSKLKSEVYVSGCSMLNEPTIPQNPDAPNLNFELYAWNNEIRS